ncbi:TPA: Rha family transcriptional regulator [Pseudomonas putida]|uniref:Rha family transcriptional regulator n=1 Tax=Pseudomonas putida TaxID=303 RepID=UPI002363B8D5|nr:Rha family transcriptional regulator [Pseudomonas putida]MDD2074990.1 Rha family transcriptional regulator [Pseudomonas putida]HDS1693311.1 Rha family transcriptional regulator [Pseudomonas putida]
MNLQVTTFRGEARIDSRLIAMDLGNNHKSTIELIDRYEPKFQRFGHLPFQTEVGKRAQGGGKAERFALLNEDQSYFLLSLSRNSEIVVDLKADLVMAFREARNKEAVTSLQYLPLYKEMHDEVKALALRAEERGSTTPERIFHINANKAINSAMGIASGARDSLTLDQQILLTTLQAVFRNQLKVSLDAGEGHKEAAKKAKDAAVEFVKHAGKLLIGSS